MTIRTAEDFARATGVSRETRERLEIYVGLLRHWQSRINLVARTTLPELWERHMLDSYQLLKFIPPATAQIADLGSGAGFPGLVLAIALQEKTQIPVELIESDQRKSAFLREVIRQTGAPAHVTTARLETLPPLTAQCLTSRALAPLPKLLDLISPHWKSGMTGLFLKGQGIEAEIRSCSPTWKLHYDLVPSETDSAARIFILRSLGRV